jgi:autotransporter-associated beta strand protein
MLCSGQFAHAQTWDGGGGDNLWNNGGASGNWTGAAAPANNGTADITFGGSNRLTPDMDANWSISSLTFDSGAGAFTLGSTGGFTLTIQGGGVTNNSTSTETIDNAITLGAAQTWNATSGNLSFGGNIDNGGFLLTISGGSNTSSSGVISGSGGLTKNEAGTLALSGPSTYTGATTINAGSLFVNGSTAAASAVTVNNSGSTLGGSGTINGSVNVASSGANLSPGASGIGSTAILHTGALTLSSGSNFNIDLNNTTAGTGYDQATVTDTVSINGSNLIVAAGSSLSIGDKFFILLNDSTDLVTGAFAQGGTVTASNNGDTFVVNYLDNGDGGAVGNDISLTVTSVPEPGTWIAGGLALVAIALHQRRRLRSRTLSELRSLLCR